MLTVLSSTGGRGSPTSNSGGRTTTGSGPRPSYGGGRYYGGGSVVPYQAGARSPLGIAPFFLIGAALAFWPIVFLHGAYIYPFSHPYTYFNVTTGQNETKPVNCLCAAFQVCGCDDNEDPAWISSLIGDGSYAQLNKTLINPVLINGTSSIFIDGTLPNGTTAPGGTEDPLLPPSTNAGAGMGRILEAVGFWPVVAAVAVMVFAA